MRCTQLLLGSLAFLSMSYAHLPVAQGGLFVDTVPVGNAGNAADTTGFGSVAYEYRIGRTEVTNAQYVGFLNAVDPNGTNSLALFNPSMTSNPSGGIQRDVSASPGTRYTVKNGRANNPVNFVSSLDAMRFANWMHNGQAAASTETGAYTINASNPLSITRNPGAQWALTSENEWYKAAYHSNDGITGNYTRYGTQTDTKPYSASAPGTAAPDVTNAANIFFDDGINNAYDNGYASNGQTSFPSDNALFDVAAYTETTSAYGLFDIAGSLHEWNESVINSNRGFRGGSFWSGSFNVDLDDSFQRFPGIDNNFEERDFGFRLTSFAAVPEPSSLLPLLAAGMAIGRQRRRRSI